MGKGPWALRRGEREREREREETEEKRGRKRKGGKRAARAHTHTHTHAYSAVSGTKKLLPASTLSPACYDECCFKLLVNVNALVMCGHKLNAETKKPPTLYIKKKKN